MGEVTITCIVPTIGRPSLYEALESCAGADEIIVVVDDAKAGGWQPGPLAANVQVVHVPKCNRGGHSSRNHAMPLATGTHLCFLDDDDVYTPDAIRLFREHACDRPVIFRMDHPRHGILWRDPEVRFGNVSTQMFVVPNDPERLASWEPYAPELHEQGGDYTFLAGCAASMGDPVWREEIVAVIRPTFPTIAIVTPWLNHLELVEDYAAAVAHRSHRDRVFIVDNGSDPPLPVEEWVRQGWATGANVYRENAGFSAGCNSGLLDARSDAVVFLNNDIVAFRPDWLSTIRDALEPGVLVGAELRFDPHGMVDGQALPYLDGWCIGGMRDDLLDLGGFDEGYGEPAYYSDNDLCLRARAAGMKLRAANVGLRHKLNVTAGRTAEVTRVTNANRERFIERARQLVGVAA